MHDVASTRDEALKMAQSLMAEGAATGVKVIKETYNAETGDYLTLKIFEDGHNQSKVEPAAEDVPNVLPCFKPDDLYSYHARATMARLLGDYLARQKLTVTELIHRADALEKFEATGTIYQHAVQKIAVAQASSTKKPVQQIIKDLNELATKAIGRVYRDDRKGYFPEVATGKFSALADKLASDGDGAYVLNGALAKHLADAKGWDEKLRPPARASWNRRKDGGIRLRDADPRRRRRHRRRNSQRLGGAARSDRRRTTIWAMP